MKQFTLAVVMVISLINSPNAQNKTYFGLEFSVFNDIYEIKDNGNYLKAIPLVDAQGGINIRHEISRKIFIEAGVILKQYWEGYGFKTIRYPGAGTGDPAWLIPVRSGLNLNIYKEKIFLVPVIGYSLGLNPPFGYGAGRDRTVQSSTITVTYNDSENPNVARDFFPLLQTGIGFEFQLFKMLLFSISTNYYKGFDKITQLDINYTVNNSPPTTGTATSKGDFWCVSTGVKYPISNFWTTKQGQ